MDANYPMMSRLYDERAPWNEEEVKEREFEIDVECTLRKNRVKVATSDYMSYDVEDDDGAKEEVIDTKSTDWKRAFLNGHYTVTELLDILARYVENDLKESGVKSLFEVRRLRRLLDDCRSWELYYDEFSESYG